MIVTKEAIKRFFRNECTLEEQEQVLAFFQANPEEFAQYLDEREWETFEAGVMDPVLSQKLFDAVQRQTIKRTNNIRTFRKLAIAASLLLVVGLSWVYLNNNKQESAVAKSEYKRSDSLSFVVRHEVNTTSKEKRILLPDGSLIVLENNSEVTFREPFADRRDISLIGKALFKVAKDSTKPFTVASGDLTTTALGTAFTITAFKNSKSIIVRLYEGKVVVKAVDAGNVRMKKDVYLLPGQEFIYGDKIIAQVKGFKLKHTVPEQIMSEERLRDHPSIPKDEQGSWYMFNNQRLDQVLDQLEALYNVKIVYNEMDVRNIYFTGKYNKTFSVEMILKQICAPNHLTVSKKDSAFIISR